MATLSIGANTDAIIQSQIQSQKNNTEEKKELTSTLQLPKSFTEEPSGIRKAQYGADMETNLVGDIWRLGESAIESLSPDVTFGEARQNVEQERLDWLYNKYPEFAGGQYDNDIATWGGRTATLLLDPVYFLMPWGLALRGATMAGKMGKLAMMGGAVGTGDAAIRQYNRTGEVTPSALLLGGGIGAVAGPVGYGVQKLGGAALNKAFPNLFKNKEQADAVEDLLKKNYQNKYDLNATQLQRVEEVSTLKSIQKLFSNIVTKETAANQFFTPMRQVIDKLQKIGTKKKYKGIGKITFKVQGQSVTLADNSQTSINKAIQEVKKIYSKAGAKFNDDVNQARHKHFVKVLQELEKRESLTTKMIRPLVALAARPLVGAGMGAVYGTLWAETEDQFNFAVAAGASMGLTHKFLMSGRAKGISIPKQKIIAGQIKKNYIQNILRNISIGTSMSQWSKMSARGPVTDSFAATIFSRPTDTVQRTFFGRVAKDQSRVIGSGNSVEDLTQQNFAFWIGGITDSLGVKNSAILDSAKGKLFRNRYLKSQEKLNLNEQNIIDAEQQALMIVRGAKIPDASPEAKQMARNIKEYLKNFKKYFNDVGFQEKELLDNYFPRKFNFAEIENNKQKFIKDLTTIYDNLKANPKSRLTASQRKQSSKTLATDYYNRIKTPDNSDIITLNESGKIVSAKTSLPLSKHINEQRTLQGSWDEVEKHLTPYLVNDIRGVLTDITQATVKSVEFARVFGAEGDAINGYLMRIYKQYQDSGFKEINNGYFNHQHKGDVKSIKDAVNSYFGRYGTQVDDWQKGTAAILSTMANFSMMDKVTIANLGDLVQPFQNSRHWLSWWKGIGFNKGSRSAGQLEVVKTNIAKSNLKEAYTTSTGESSSLILKNGKAGNFMNIIGKSNELFFKMIGLEGITNIARRYAYNVGAIDAHKTSQLFVKQLGLTNPNVRIKNININNIKNKKLLNEVMHLQKAGALKINNNGDITNLNEVINFGRAKNLNEALNNPSSSSIIQRVGVKAADRDAIIPTVGNRLLFTQTRNPWMRLIGQFSSWAMAKSAQTNAMISRIESGELKQLVTSLSALSVYGGIKEIREWAKYGEWNISNDFEDDKGRWLADATELSGNLGWLPSTILNNLFGYSANRPTDIAPAFTIARDIAEVIQTSGGFIGLDNFDEAMKELYDTFPAPTIRKILSRLGVPIVVYKKDMNIPLDFQVKKNKQQKKYEQGLYGQFKKLLEFNEGGLADEDMTMKVEEKPQEKIKTEYQYDLKTEVDYKEDVSDKKQLDTLIAEGPKIVPKQNTPKKIVPKEKPVPPLSFLFKNNNPGMVKVSSNWKGETFTGSSGEVYKKYSSKDEGLADIINTIKQYKVNDLNTIMGIYAKDDASGKRAVNYENILRKQFGVPNKIDFNNPSHVEALLKGITHVENSTVGQKYNYPVGSYNQYYLQEDYDKTLKRLGFHSGGMAHTHGPKKSKPKKSSWKSLFTSNQAYGGSTPPVQSSSSSSDDDNKGKYIASTKGGTTKPPKTIVKSSDGGGDNNVVKKVIKKIKEDAEIQTNIPFPKDEKEITVGKIHSLFDKGTEFNIGSSGAIGDNMAYTIGAGLTSANPLKLSDPLNQPNQLDTFNAYGGVGIDNAAGTFSGGVTYEDDTFTGNITQSFDQPSLLDKIIGENKISPYIGITKTEAEDPKLTGGITFNFKSGGLLDRKRLNKS